MIKKHKNLIAVITIVLLSLFVLTACSEDTTTEETTQAVSVTSIPADLGTVANTIMLSGQITANESVDVVPKLAGVVSKVNVSVGDSVSKGQTLFTLENEDYSLQVQQAQASYNLAVASYEDAKRTHERMRNLYNEGAISQSQLEQSSLAMDAASPVAAKAALDLAKSQYNNTIITAPMSGLVSAVNVTAGSIASQQMPSVTIVEINKVKLLSNVSESNINKLKVGQEVQVTVASASSTPFAGSVTAVSPASNAQTMTFPVEVTIPNADRLIKPGMFGEIRLVTDQAENVLLVPLEALIGNGIDYQVYVIKNGVAHLTDVKVGMQDDTQAQIISGLLQGDRVVISGQDQLRDGIQVVETVAGGENTDSTTVNESGTTSDTGVI